MGGPAVINLVGRKFGKVTVLAYSHAERFKTYRRVFWRCRCECGAEWAASGHALKAGDIVSCGCARTERIGNLNRAHGMADKHPAYSTWLAMRQRCANPNHKSYQRYGGRGIRVCNRWAKFENFWADMEGGWAPGLTIERKRVNGNYTPSNCIWIPAAEQAKNTRKTIRIDTPWGRMTLADAARKSGLAYHTLRNRVRCDWPADVLFDPSLKGD